MKIYVKKKSKESKNKRQKPRVKNYAEIFRRLHKFFKPTFKLPVWNKNLTKKQQKIDYNKARNSTKIKNLYDSGNFTPDEIIKLIKRMAIDYNINRNLKPQQKSSITRRWYGKTNSDEVTHRYKSLISSVEKGRSMFIDIRNIRGKPQYDRMFKTNRGIFLYEKDAKVKVLGRGKKEILSIKEIIPDYIKHGGERPGTIREVFTRKTIFYPWNSKGLMSDFIKGKYDSEGTKPSSMALGVGSSSGNIRHTDLSQMKYIDSVIATMRSKGERHPFSGVYFYWY